MFDVRHIDGSLCEQLLAEHGDNPLLACLDRVDAKTLLRHSFIAEEHDGELCHIEPKLGDFTRKVLRDYYGRKLPADFVLPTLLVEGSYHYFLTSDTLSKPLEAVFEAPVVHYYAPYSEHIQTLYPGIAVSPYAKGIFFHPDLFKQTARKYPKMYEYVIEERERILGALFNYLTMGAMASTSYRIGRLLFSLLPSNFKESETITITQHAMAEMLECSRASVSSSIAYLYDKKIIQTGHGRVTVDTARLKEYLHKG